MDDCEGSSRSAIADDVQIETLVKNNPGQMTRDIAEILRMSPINIVSRLTSF